jgi:CheY-like chemotaxis protein
VHALQGILLLLIVCIGLAAVQPALAATDGPRTGAVLSSGTSWSNFTTTSLSTNDDNRASNSTNDDYGVLNNFGFNIPAGSQIDGIQVDVEGSCSKNKTVNYAVDLSGNGGSGWTTPPKSDSFTGMTDATHNLGGLSDNWSWTWGAAGFSDTNFRLRIYRTGGSDNLQIDLIQVTVYYTPVPNLSWATGSADFKIYQSSSLIWGAGTLVCSGTLSDDNGSTIDCTSGAIANSTQYRVQVVLDNTGAADATMASGDYVDHVAVKGGWAGTSPTLGNCAFEDLDSDNTAATCSAAWNATNDVRITNTGTEVNIAYSATNNAEGFMYLITTGSDVPAVDSTSYMNTSIDSVTEDSSKISINGPTAPVHSWATGSADFEIWASSNLTWDNGTLVCSGTLNDDNGSTIDCTSGAIANSTQYRVQVVLKNTGTADATMASGDYVDHVAVKGGWAGSSPTLGNCAFEDLDSDNTAATCGAAWNATNDVRITNTGTEVKIAYSAINNAEGFMYLITTDSDVPAVDSTSYMDTSIDSVTEDSSKITINGPAPDLTWATGSADFRIYESSSLTWGDGTLVCGGILSDDNASTIDCNAFTLDNSTQYRVQVVLKNTGTADATMASGDYVDHVAVKGGWAGTSPTLGNCAFEDLDSDNTTATCSAAWNATNDVRLTNTGTEVKIAYSATNKAEGFMYLITTDSDVPANDSTSYMDASIDSDTEDSSKISIDGPFPAVQDTNTSGESSDVTSHTVNLPANISAGDLLIVFFSCDGNTTVTWPAADGWASIFHQTNLNTLDIGYKIADGTEGANIIVTTGASEQSAHISYRITGHDYAQAPQVSTGAIGNSTDPDSDSLTPTGGAKDYLWIAVEGNDNTSAASAYPSNYTNGQTNAVGDAGGANIAVARRELNASSEDPAPFTITREKWVACTVAVQPRSAATAVSLVSFTAQGQGRAVSVEWQTAREFDNVGFHLYRSSSPAGPFERINDKLISATLVPSKGGHYSYLDTDVNVGSLYYYKLEDIDVYGKHTEHGPICVDWDADKLPDDWEITHGLNPWVNDADLDYDNDGLSNFEEYERDLDPFNADTDGDGIGDGEEDGRIYRQQDDPGSHSISRGVEVLDSDDTGMTLALSTSGFEAEVVVVGGQEFEKLKIADYVHGYTSDVGAPQLPLEGLMINVPADKAAQLTVVDSQVEPFSGYRIYPVPEAVLDNDDGMAAVGAAFVQDEIAYSTDGFYPQQVADLGKRYLFGDQLKQQVSFYPIGFNPASGELLLYRRIELRIDYVDARYANVSEPLPMPWQPPQSSGGVLSSVALGFAAASMLTGPISPILSSLGAAVSAFWSPPDAADGDVYKIITDGDGIYRISKDYLVTNGVDTDAINLSALRIYYLGEEIAIEVFDQNNDDHFDDTDYIRFYAAPVDRPYAKYSNQNVYWLTLAGGSFVPLRMGSIEAAPAGGPVAADFADIAHTEQNIVYWLKAPGADGIERWFYNTYVQGDEHAGGGLPKAFTIKVPQPTSSGTLTILMAGQTDTFHEVKVAINGVEQNFSWAAISYYQATLDDVPLFEGDNTVTLQCLSVDGNDSIIVDWFEVAYRRDYVVGTDNIFKFAPDSGTRYLIDGFTSNNLIAYDISDPADVAIIENPAISGAAPYSFEFEPTVYGDTYLVLASEAGKVPQALIEDRPADLAHNASGADYILITHRDLGWAQNGDPNRWLTDLVALREAQGLRVEVVDIEDIYDEFSFGIKSPQALKDFLAYAYRNWPPPAPQYVLLVGDSTYDPKDHWGEADDTAYLPTYLMFTDFKGETVTDQWFVTFSGDDAVADMHIGRLPAADAAQATTMVDKIIAYESAVNARTWTNNLLLVADNQRPGSDYAYEAAFETINEEAAALIPATMADPIRGYLNDYAATAFLTNDIIDTINDGVLMVNYAGHGATQIMAEEHIFDAADVAALTNSDKLAFFVSMSCETGFFAYPEVWFFPSLAEALMRSEAGAIAALMPTGMTSTEGQQVLDAAVFEAIFKKDIRTLGPAIAEAKQTLLANGDDYFEQISDTFLLFGDPATALQLPLPHIPNGIRALRDEGAVTIDWDAVLDCNQNPVAGYNIYRATSAAGPFSKINPQLVTDTVFVDSDSAVGITAVSSSGSSGSYYSVSAVDDAGFESSQSLAVSPASIASSGAESIEGVTCFINTTASPAAFNLTFTVLVIIVSIMLGFWLLQTIFKPQNKKNTIEKKMNPFNELKNVKTLLVDDDEFIRNSLELAFKTKGCCLQVAESAEQGLQAIKAQQFDIIISDLRLPGMSGLEFLKLTSVTQPQAIRFLITAYRDDHIFSEAVRLGVNEFIEKPFAVKVLINLLALALKRQTRRKEATGI